MSRQGKEPDTKQPGRLRPMILRASQVTALIMTLAFSAVGFEPTPKGVYIQIDDTVVYQETTEKNVADILATGDFEVEEGSIVEPGEQALVQDGMYITISTPKTITLQVGETTETIETTSLTVEDLIAEKAIDTTQSTLQSLSPLDYIKEDTTIVFNETEVKQETTQETQPLGVEYKTDDTLYEGEEKVIQEGTDQEITKTYDVTYVNGTETQRTLVSEAVTKEGQPEIIAQGTKVREVEVVATSTAMTQSASMTMELSGYSIEGSIRYGECTAASGYEICNSAYYNHPTYGTIRIVAADTSIIPMGSIIEIDGFGKAIVLDTGSYIKGNRLDLLFATDAEALAWGRNNVGVAIVE
ncbi:MAG: G5 domain-containing protein [Culicoidibacterales bacterium]